MENEKDLLNKDLETTNDAAGLEKLKEDAELLGHEDIVAKAQEKINALNTQAGGIMGQVAEKTERVESTGGDMKDLEAQVAPVQEEMKEVQKNAGEEIAAVEINEEEFKIRNPEEDKLGAILDIAKLMRGGNREKVPYTDEQISDIAEKALIEATQEDAKKEGDDTHYHGYLSRIVEAGIDVNKDQVKQNLDRIIGIFIKNRIETKEKNPDANVDINRDVVDTYGQFFDYAVIDKNKDWTVENKTGSNENQEKVAALESEVNDMLKGISERLPGQLSEVYESETYNSLVDLNEKRKKEEKELFGLYDQYTTGSTRNRRDFALGEYGEQMHHYIHDLKANVGVPQGAIARFENYATAYKQPENKANEQFRDLYAKTINQDRWTFEKDLNEKATEAFGSDRAAAESFKKKAFDKYQEILSAAEEQTIPGKTKYINTMGTYYGVPNK